MGGGGGRGGEIGGGVDIGEDLLCTWKVSLVMQDNVIIFCNGFLFHHNHVLWSLCTDMNKLSLM